MIQKSCQFDLVLHHGSDEYPGRAEISEKEIPGSRVRA